MKLKLLTEEFPTFFYFYHLFCFLFHFTIIKNSSCFVTMSNSILLREHNNSTDSMFTKEKKTGCLKFLLIKKNQDLKLHLFEIAAYRSKLLTFIFMFLLFYLFKSKILNWNKKLNLSQTKNDSVFFRGCKIK